MFAQLIYPFRQTLKWMIGNLMMKTGHLKQVMQLQEDWILEHLKPGYLLVLQTLEYEQCCIVLVLHPSASLTGKEFFG